MRAILALFVGNILFAIAGGILYLCNIYQLAMPLIGMELGSFTIASIKILWILKAIGILFPPLGAVMGFIGLF
jgi:hypothetical protein